MNTEIILVVISSIVLVSYLFDMFSGRTRLPSVVLLILSGLALRLLSDWTGYAIPYLGYVLAPLGTVGLILIVLEAGLDLELNLEKASLIRKSLLSAAAGLGLCLAGISGVYMLLFEVPARVALLNALPLAIISSAVAIPGARLFSEARREFITYESSFSDILGILVFNYLALNASFGAGAFFSFGFEVFVTVLLSLFFSLGLTALVERIDHQVKHLPVFAILLLVYATAKLMHYSPLILVLVFGLFLNNITLFIRGNMRLYFSLDKIGTEVRLFKSVISETTFVIKTFFFVLLGYTADIPRLLDRSALAVVLPVLLLIYASRVLSLRLLWPAPTAAALTYVAPRGLITILLFMGIPDELRIRLLPDSVLLWTILLTALVLTWGVFKHAGDAEPPPLPARADQA
ncbi:MAG: sodium:proton exchanger [Elusimicrobia bacterium HGW-Elusimicrobia-3]|nr:MAG: sodium:proton exchanger [Elusimicrobia bacterium HGW-Elusimicrobia-3]